MSIVQQFLLVVVGLAAASSVTGFAPALVVTRERSTALDATSTEWTRRTLFGATAAMAVIGAPSLVVAATDNDDIVVGGKPRLGDEGLMANKEHGSTATAVQESLRYGVSRKTADRICSYNRRFAEYGGYFEETTLRDVVLSSSSSQQPVTFYDSVTGLPLFRAPIGRTPEEFLRESSVHGWPSFRDQEVVWDNVRVLRNSGETVSVAGTHLGHNLPDKNGNRYCINLVSVAGNPMV